MPSLRSCRRAPLLVLVFVLAVAAPLRAALFVVPSDGDLIGRADAIVVGSALSSFSRSNAAGGIETVTEISVEEVLKGAVSTTFDVVEPGGEFDGTEMLIPGVPRFENGRRMLLLLARTGPLQWAVAELVLGKFTFATDRSGRGVLLRDEDEIRGWNPDLKIHVEGRRSSDAFLRYVRAEVRGENPPPSYWVSSLPVVSQSVLTPSPAIAPYSATSYTMTISGSMGSRWTVFPNAVPFYRGVTTEPGAPGGGDTAIDMGMAAWNNDCPSNVNYVYAGVDNGTHTQGLHAPDGENTILFEQDLSAWGVAPFTCSSNGYSGTLGIGGITSASSSNALGSETFVTTQEADVMMNTGLANCTLLFSTGDFNSALTHELGHTLGFRHSDQNRSSSAACSTDPSLECSSSAIMTAVETAGLNATLQTWDQHAVEAVYPGGSCSSAGRVKADFNGDGRSDVLWRNGSTGANTVWLMNGITVTNGVALSPTDTNWKVGGIGDFNADGHPDILWRNTATGAVGVWLMSGTSILSATTMATVPTNWQIAGLGDVNGDGTTDVVWWNSLTGDVTVWLMNGASPSGASVGTVADTNWQIVGVGDFNGDGKTDIFWRNMATGANGIWFLNGASIALAASTNTVSDLNYKVAAVGDTNGDGKADIVWRHQVTGAVVVWLMNGVNPSGGLVATVSDLNDHIEGIGDFDGDGRADLIWRRVTTGDVAVWLMNGNTIKQSGFVSTVSDLNWSIVAPK